MEDFLKFKKMLTPILIQIIFILGSIACVIGGAVVFMDERYSWLFDARPIAVALMVIGPLTIRLICELLVVIFSINDSITEIKNLTKHGQ